MALSQAGHSLTKSSSQFMGVALDAFAAEPKDSETVYLCGALALEHLSKAVLVEVNPTLVAFPRHFESMYLLATSTDQFEVIAPRIRTISLTESISRAGRFVEDVEILEGELSRVVTQRNTVAHVGIVTSDEVMSDLITVLKALTVMIDHIGYSRKEFFGGYAQTVEGWISESVSELRADVEAKIDRARREFASRWGEEPTELDLGIALHGKDWDDPENAQVWECPACETEAVVYGEIDVEVEPDFDRWGEIVGAGLVPWFVVRMFNCRACGLRLQGDEITESDVDRRFKVYSLDIDPHEYWADEYDRYERW